MSAGDVGGALLDCAEALQAGDCGRSGDIEADEGRRCVHPAIGLASGWRRSRRHRRSRGEGRRLLSSSEYTSTPSRCRLGELGLAEGVAEPAHGHSAVEADSLDHPPLRDCVAKGPQAGPRIDQRLVEHDRVLPEGAPTTVNLPGSVSPSPNRASWVSAPPTTTAVPAGSRRRCGLRPDSTHDGPGGHPRGRRSVEPGHRDHVVGPVRGGEIKHARARAQRRIGHELAAQAGQNPVAEHPEVSNCREDVGFVRAIQRRRAGAVIATQSPARS